MIGRVLAQRYEVLENIGEGALFQAFKARDRSLNRIVTLKTPHANFARNPAFSQALTSASQDQLELAHANIARVLDVVFDADSPIVVSEFVRGINLRERIRRIAPFTLSVAVDFGISIAEAVQHAHASGILHGDLRPHNIIVSPEGVVKVTDFGLLPALASSGEAATANLVRSAPYLAPEVGLGHAATIASDVYSLGIMLYEMLAGSAPFTGDTPSAIALKHQNEPAPSPRQTNPGVPRSVEGIILKALQKRPENRYANLGDMLNDLKAVRDALRFGKPLSWNPMERPSNPSISPAAQALATAAPIPVAPPPPSRPVEEMPFKRRVEERIAVAEPAPAIPKRRRDTMANDDRISPYLKLAMASVIVIFIAASTVGAALWMSNFSKPPEKRFPNLVGMKIEDARKASQAISIRLIEHEQFSEKFDAGIVYKSDWEPGKLVRPGRQCNVWVSRGSKMVWVPDVTRQQAEEAEKKLKEAGLVLGSVGRETNERVGFDQVASQNPRAGKRVPRDSSVNLIISDGSKPLEPDTTNDETNNNDNQEQDRTPNSYTLNVTITPDGRGNRRVRIEYDDVNGTHVPIDEFHNEGDRISERVEVTGSEITVRVYYGDDQTPVSEQRKRVRPRG